MTREEIENIVKRLRVLEKKLEVDGIWMRIHTVQDAINCIETCLLQSKEEM